MDIRSKNKTAIDHVLWVIPACLLAYAVYQYHALHHHSFVNLSMWRFFYLFVLLTAISAVTLLVLGRRTRPALPPDAALIAFVLLCYLACVDRGLFWFLIAVTDDIFMPYKSVHVYALDLLPLCYALLLTLRCTLGAALSGTWWEHSLCARIARLFGRGRSVRRKLLIEIACVQVAVGALCAALWALLASMQLFTAIPSAAVWTLVLLTPILAESLLLYRMLVGKQSTSADIERIADAIHACAKGDFPSENPVSLTSPLFETGEALVTLGALTEDGIQRGIAGERLKVELITNVSHDLRTPLTSIVGYGEQLEQRTDLPADAAQTVGQLTRKAKYLCEMVNDLFDISKTASGAATMQTSRLDLHRLIEQTLGEMEDRIKLSDLATVTQLYATRTTVMADGVRLHRVLQNLIDNALKYSLHGTRIFLTTDDGDGCIRVSVLNTSAYPLDAVQDLSALTERFRRGDESRSGEGSGLGLAIVKTYTEAIGGRFDIAVRGDTFEATLTLPITDEPMP